MKDVNPGGPMDMEKAMAQMSQAALSSEQYAALAADHGLHRSGVRPKLWRYIKELWIQRHFVWVLASSDAYARHRDNYLGQLWAVLNPLLLAGAYYIIFGMLLGVDRGTENYVGFLITGLFLFLYSGGNITKASRSISTNLNLVRSLRFPRAVLPIAATLSEFILVLPSLGVLLVLMLVTGESITLEWLLFPVVVVLHLAINVGLGLIVARIVHSSRDLRNLIPLVVRLLRYVSGVFFSIDAYAGQGVLGILMKYQPFALVLDLARQAMLGEFTVDPPTWIAAAGWAVILPIVGLIYFWRAEATYGRN